MIARLQRARKSPESVFPALANLLAPAPNPVDDWKPRSMAHDHEAFWAAIETLADSFRETDPEITGKMRQLAWHFSKLPEEERVKLRLDVQLLSAHFSKLALSMSVQQSEHHDQQEPAERYGERQFATRN